MAELTDVLADLAEEGDALDAIVRGLQQTEWEQPTPAPGWTIAHQVGHLAWADEIALLAATDAAAFDAQVLQVAFAAWDGYVDRAAAPRPDETLDDLLARWRHDRAALVQALARVPAGTKLPWFGPPMSATSMATARLMETWAHGQDVVDALGIDRLASDRLRHVAHLGVRTRDFAFALRERPAPTEPFRVELVSPLGDLWTWGPDDAAQQVAGPALDFCLLVTQRRHRDDLAMVAIGTDADEWLSIAQAFAGPPGDGRSRSGS